MLHSVPIFAVRMQGFSMLDFVYLGVHMVFYCAARLAHHPLHYGQGGEYGIAGVLFMVGGMANILPVVIFYNAEHRANGCVSAQALSPGSQIVGEKFVQTMLVPAVLPYITFEIFVVSKGKAVCNVVDKPAQAIKRDHPLHATLFKAP